MTPEKIHSILQKLSQETSSFHLLFYFCGHGFRTEGNTPESYLFLSKSSLNHKSPQGAVALEPLVQKINHLNASNIYVFIDACYLRLNSIINPKLEGELKGDKNSPKNFFCLLSSGVNPSFEDTEEGYGYFTHALLQSLSAIRHTDLSPTHFVKLINTYMKEYACPLPEMYNFGMQSIDFLEKSPASYFSQGTIYRQDVIGTIQDLLTQNRKHIITLFGPEGCGKSNTTMPSVPKDKL